eukprot:4011933-Ditylum_brightwellii.AAC.1
MNAPTIPERITKNEWKQRFEVWQEDTMTSPSGRHLGCYKMLIRPHLELNSEKESSYWKSKMI